MAELLRPAALYNGADANSPVQDNTLETLILPLERSDDGWLRVEYPESATREWRFGWLAPADARGVRVGQERLCPDADAAHVLSMDATDGPACFGDRELTLAPVFLERIVPQPDAAYEGEPAWLARFGDLIVSAHPGGDSGSMMVHVAPEARILAAPQSWVAIRGHFDDPRSRACARAPFREPFLAETPAEQVLWCRQQFVMTSIEPAPAPTPIGE